MKRLTFRLAVAVVTFVAGVTSVWILVRRWSRHPAQRAAVTIQLASAVALPPAVLKLVKELPEALSRDNAASIQFLGQKICFLSMNGKLWRITDDWFSWRMVFSVQPRPDEYPPWLGQFKFIDANHGWLVSNETLYKTDDGGLHWQVIQQPIEYNDRDLMPVGITDFALLPDGKHAWIIGTKYRDLKAGEEYYHTRYSTSDGKKVISPLVYHTADAGRTWKYQPLPDNAYDLWAIDAFDKDHAWAAGLAGTFYFENGKWRISSANASGERELTGDGCLATYIGAPTNAPVSFYFTDANTGWITNTNGQLGRTSDGGKHWQDLPDAGLGGSGNNEGYWPAAWGLDIHFLDQSFGYGIDGNGYLQRTVDGGRSWDLIEKSSNFTDLFVLDAENVWVASSAGVFKLKPDRLPAE